MQVIGLTGGIGSGKTTVRKLFEAQNIATLDADAFAKQLVEKGQPALQHIADAFGDSILTNNGDLNRAKLADLIFKDAAAKHTLENILHPLIRQKTAEQLAAYAQQGHALAVVEIPLLAETGKPDYIDQVLVIDVTPKTQLARALSRGKHSKVQLTQIINQQASRAERLAIADIVLDGEQPLDLLEKEIGEIIQRYR